MYSPVKLIATNIMSYRELIIDFEEGASLIYGINNCDEGQTGNGSGKSVAMEAIVIALLGKVMRPDAVIRDLITRGEEEMNISLTLSNPMLNTTLDIERTFHKTKSQKAVIKENHDIVETTDANHVNTTILSFLDIPREDLMNYYLIDKMRFQSFFSGGDAAKKQVIGRFSNIELLDPAFAQMKQNIKDDGELIDAKNLLISKDEGSIETLNTTLAAEEKRDLQKEQNDIIERIESQITEKEKKITETEAARLIIQKNIKPSEDAIKKQEKEIEERKKKINTAKETQEEIKTSIKEVEVTINLIKDKKAEADRLIIGKVQCPECKHEFNGSDPTKDLKKVTQAIPGLVAMLTEEEAFLKQEKIDLENTTSSLNKDNQSNQLLQDKIDDANRAIRGAKRDVEEYEKDEKRIREEVEELKVSLATAKENQITSVVQSIKDAIKEKEDNVKAIREEISSISTDIDYENTLMEHFTRFKTQLVNKTIGVIQFFTNKYLDQMGSSLSVSISGYKINKDKSISEKITTMVNRDGIKVGPIGPYSQGERGRIDIAGILALQSQINGKSTSGGLNLLFLDEIVESIDEGGITGILSSLDNLGKHIYIITHSKYEGNHPRVIEVVKEPGEISTWNRK